MTVGAAWTDVRVAAIGASSVVVGVIVQSWLSSRQGRGARDRADRAARVDRIAQVLGPIQTLLIDLLPPRAMFNSSDADIGRHRQERWLPLRDRWEVVIVMEPSESRRASMRELEVEIENLYNRIALALSGTSRIDYDEQGHTFYDDAVDHHDRATRIADELASALHR